MDTKLENEQLKKACKELHWMARRYADGRQSYATSLFNEITRLLISLGVELNLTADNTIWARDASGREFDKLTDEEAAQGKVFYDRKVEEIEYWRNKCKNLEAEIEKLNQSL